MERGIPKTATTIRQMNPRASSSIVRGKMMYVWALLSSHGYENNQVSGITSER